MKIELINKIDLMQDVWKLSRPYLHKEDLPSNEDLIKMNLPINQFKRVALHITSSILFRDLLFTFRPINVWARSNRTIKFNKDNIKLAYDEINRIYPNSSKVTKKLEADLDKVIDRVNSGEKQDYVKKSLPLLTETEFCIDIDYRQLVNILYTFELHCKPLHDVFLISLFESNSDIISRAEYDTYKKVDLFSRVSLTEADYSLTSDFTSCGDMFAIRTRIRANLMAQFIRQHSSTIKNELWNAVDNNLGKVALLNCDISLYQVAYILESQLRNLTSTRTCWFSQFDKEDDSSWSYILKDVVSNMTEMEFLAQLPCGGDCNKCSIEGDMVPRIKHTEVNPPCPILIENPYIIDQRFEEYKSDSTIMNKWRLCKPYINYNADNKYNKIYSELNMESGTNVYMENNKMDV